MYRPSFIIYLALLASISSPVGSQTAPPASGDATAVLKTKARLVLVDVVVAVDVCEDSAPGPRAVERVGEERGGSACGATRKNPAGALVELARSGRALMELLTQFIDGGHKGQSQAHT